MNTFIYSYRVLLVFLACIFVLLLSEFSLVPKAIIHLHFKQQTYSYLHFRQELMHAIRGYRSLHGFVSFNFCSRIDFTLTWFCFIHLEMLCVWPDKPQSSQTNTVNLEKSSGSRICLTVLVIVAIFECVSVRNYCCSLEHIVFSHRLLNSAILETTLDFQRKKISLMFKIYAILNVSAFASGFVLASLLLARLIVCVCVDIMCCLQMLPPPRTHFQVRVYRLPQ